MQSSQPQASPHQPPSHQTPPGYMPNQVIYISIANNDSLIGLTLGILLKISLAIDSQKDGTYSQLSLNGNLYKIDTSLRRTPCVGPGCVLVISL